MILPSRRQQSSTTSHHLQPTIRHRNPRRPNMNNHPQPQPGYHKPLRPPKLPTNPNHSHHPRSSRKIGPNRPSPLTPSSNRRTNTGFSPTPLKHHGSSRHLPTNPNFSHHLQQPNSNHSLPNPRSNHLPIRSRMCPHPKRHKKNHRILNLQSTWTNNNHSRA